MNSLPLGQRLGASETSRRARLLAAHFGDYTPGALRLWLAIVAFGAVALASSLVALVGASAEQLVPIGLGLALVCVAAWFPISIPRSRYSVSAADTFIFALLAAFGAPAAVLAAGCDGLIGSWRSSKRLTSRISTPAAAMAAMAVTALLFEPLCAVLASTGWNPAVVRLAALVAVALVPFVLTTYPLLAIVSLKRGSWPGPRNWLSSVSWVGAMYLAAALLAGVVRMLAERHGLPVMGIVAAAVLGVIALLRVSIARNEAEYKVQEERIQHAERDAELNQQRFAAAFAKAAIGMAIVDTAGRVQRVNEACSVLLGRGEDDLIGQPLSRLLRPGDPVLFERQAQTVALGAGSAAPSIELRCRDGDGHALWIALHCGRFTDPGTGDEGFIYQLQDITSRRNAEARLQHIAYHDDLTDLPNRACFHRSLADAVEASRVDPEERFAVMFLDVDRFKIVNDSLGHFAGNELLREVGRRLRQCVRPTDLVARLGGDEFGILLRELHDQADGKRLAEKILSALAVPLAIGANETMPSASLGITYSDLGYRSVDELLRDADLAMYEAKATGRGRMAIFDRSMHDRIADRLALETDLRRAIGEGALHLSFQPIFRLDRYQLSGFEALARWVHPTRGSISPTVFVRLAEETGHIHTLTAWVLDRAISQLAAWRRSQTCTDDTGVSVNISGRDLIQPEFVDRVLECLERLGVRPELLTLEVTESVLMDRLELAGNALERLRASGVRLAIDDFGTGYSSLGYLSKLPIDTLKIDRSFASAMDGQAESIEIVRAIVTLGGTLSKEVVAEGIESPDQLEKLRKVGVLYGQGYLLGRPMAADQVPAFLDTSSALPL